MADPQPGESPAPQGFTCPFCGSDRVRRSAPRGGLERLLRSLTPFHFYRCRACGHRGWHAGRVGRRRRRSPPPPGRPVEKRDLEVVRARRNRAVVAVAAAVGLGAASGLLVHSCQHRVPSMAPGRK